MAPSELLNLPTATPPPNQISFTVASGGPSSDIGGDGSGGVVSGSSIVSGVSGQQLGLLSGVGLPANVLESGDVTSDPLSLGVGKSSIDFGDSDSEMTDGQSIQTPGKPKRVRVSLC